MMKKQQRVPYYIFASIENLVKISRQEAWLYHKKDCKLYVYLIDTELLYRIDNWEELNALNLNEAYYVLEIDRDDEDLSRLAVIMNKNAVISGVSFILSLALIIFIVALVLINNNYPIDYFWFYILGLSSILYKSMNIFTRKGMYSEEFTSRYNKEKQKIIDKYKEKLNE